MILITGANRGIGLELARQWHERGEPVLATCRQPSPELEALGVEVVPGIDVADAAVGDKLRRAVGTRRLQVLVNNAGVLGRETFADLDFDSIRRQFDVNALGPLRVTQALAGRIADGGKVAMITSRMGSIGDNSSGGYYGYRMSKAALNIAAVSLAHDLHPRGIAVAILHPGFVRTEMTGGQGNVHAADSATGLIAQIDALTLATSGRFVLWTGEPLPW